MRLIDADAFKEKFTGQYEFMKRVIDGEPTAYKVKHAHVIVNFDGDTKCSECGCEHIDSSMPYCANCGARLDEPTQRDSFNE